MTYAVMTYIVMVDIVMAGKGYLDASNSVQSITDMHAHAHARTRTGTIAQMHACTHTRACILVMAY